jgi:hypothetical protein
MSTSVDIFASGGKLGFTLREVVRPGNLLRGAGRAKRSRRLEE